MHKDRKCGDCKHYRLHLEGSGDQQQTSIQKKKQNTSILVQTVHCGKLPGVADLSSWCVYKIKISTSNSLCGVWIPSKLESFKPKKQAGHFCLQCSFYLSKVDAVPCKCTVRLQNFDNLCYHYVNEVIFMSFKTFQITTVKYNCTSYDSVVLHYKTDWDWCLIITLPSFKSSEMLHHDNW
jgi:hypothetical protein